MQNKKGPPGIEITPITADQTTSVQEEGILTTTVWSHGECWGSEEQMSQLFFMWCSFCFVLETGSHLADLCLPPELGL